MTTKTRDDRTALAAVTFLTVSALLACNGGSSATDTASDAGADAPETAAEADAAEDAAEEGRADVRADDGGEEQEEDAVDVAEGAADAADEAPDAVTDVGEAADADADVEEDAADAPAETDDDIGGDVADETADGDEETPLAPCPDDMVPWGAICIDRYEASRPDATEVSAGTDESRATSRPGVLPWFVNPMSATALTTFEAACAAAGKRLCRAEEWESACRGPLGLPYVYGTLFDREACNCVDTFCDDYCVEHGIPEASCDTLADCGYRYGCLRMLPTGSMPGCANELGHFDINGNVWEVVRSTTDTRGYEIRGGAFNCAAAAVRVSCTFNAGWLDLFAGFRCCKDR